MTTRRGLTGLLAASALLMLAAGRRRRSCGPASSVEAGKTDPQALTRLVKAELDRHPTHRAADEDCQGYLTVEMIDLGAAERAVGHRAHQHAGAVSREGRRRRDRPGGAAAAGGRAEQRSADPAGPRIEHLAAAPGPRARAAQRDALRRRALRAGHAARRVVRHDAGRRDHRAARGERAARRRAAGRRVQSRSATPTSCTCARSSTRRSRPPSTRRPPRTRRCSRARCWGSRTSASRDRRPSTGRARPGPRAARGCRSGCAAASRRCEPRTSTS